jgi:SAM-dependent MidA family methyltransferase
MPSISRSNPSPPLREWLTGQGGAVPFRRFMEAALYDPEFGYYTRQIKTVGVRGDFSTSATLSPLLGRGIAAWIRRMAAGPAEGIRHLIEIGPGTGQLHAAVRQALGWKGRWHWRSHLVERSPNLRAEQERLLGRAGRRLQWHSDPAEALAAAEGKALIFSNELVDAFPVTLLQKHDGIWQEVWLEVAESGAVMETLRPGAVPETSVQAGNFPDGQRVEVHESWRAWMEAWRPHWTAGTMLTIDYGDTADKVYYRRPEGTVRGYQNHQRFEGLSLYRSMGQCDLTADVNFTDLMRWGESRGLRTVNLLSQALFLQDLERPGCMTEARLADPSGAGGAFLCLEQLVATPPE